MRRGKGREKLNNLCPKEKRKYIKSQHRENKKRQNQGGA